MARSAEPQGPAEISRRAFLLLGGGILALAAVLRFAFIDIKPPHFDEGINGWFADGMAAQGFYCYDPANYHGPLHFYAVYASTRLFGRNLFALRLPAVLASLGCVAAGLFFSRYLGRGAALLGAFALAVSPAFVFYGRYSIHESWQVLFLMLATIAVFRLADAREASLGSWRLLGLAMAGLAATKETFVLHAGSALVAAGMLWAAGVLFPSLEWRLGAARPRAGWRGPAAAVFWFALPMGLLFSGLLAHPAGIADFFRAFEIWRGTGFEEGGGHNKPFWYWLTLMLRYEWVMLAGLGATWLCWFPGCGRARWLALTAAGVFLAYSIIPYKTPWCLISILWPLPFLLGPLAARLPGAAGAWALRVCALAAAAGLWPCVSVNFFRHSDPKEPYVYVQTSPEIARLTGPLLALAEADPRKYAITGAVWLDGSYPLPWMLGDFHAVGYFEGGERPASFNQDFVVAERESAAEVERAFDADYYRAEFTLRDGRPPVVAWFRAAVFREQFGNRAPEVRAGKGEAE